VTDFAGGYGHGFGCEFRLRRMVEWRAAQVNGGGVGVRQELVEWKVASAYARS
jgi:hypothetical protein